MSVLYHETKILYNMEVRCDVETTSWLHITVDYRIVRCLL